MKANFVYMSICVQCKQTQDQQKMWQMLIYNKRLDTSVTKFGIHVLEEITEQR